MDCPLLSVAIHPGGFYLSASFVDKIRMFYLMSNKLRIYQEIPLQNQIPIKFSQGGQYFGCVGQQTLEINIFQSFSLEKMFTLKSNDFFALISSSLFLNQRLVLLQKRHLHLESGHRGQLVRIQLHRREKGDFGRK